MIYLVCILAVIAIIVSWILIDMGISDRDKFTFGIGAIILAVVLTVGGFFYAGIKIPLVILSLVVGLPMCYHACKSMADFSKEYPDSTSEKIMGFFYWGFSMLFLAIGFYYWYYIPENLLLAIVMSIIATIAFVHAIYCIFSGRSVFLSSMTALSFSSIVFYFGEIRGILPLNHGILYYVTMAITAMIGIMFLIGLVHRINLMHEPEIKWDFSLKDLVTSPFFLKWICYSLSYPKFYK